MGNRRGGWRKLGRKGQAPWRWEVNFQLEVGPDDSSVFPVELNLSLCFRFEMSWWRLGPGLRFRGLVNCAFVFLLHGLMLCPHFCDTGCPRLFRWLSTLFCWVFPSIRSHAVHRPKLISSLMDQFLPFHCTQSPSCLGVVWLLRGFTFSVFPQIVCLLTFLVIF